MVFLEKNQGKKTILHMLMYQAWKKTKKTTPFFGKKPKSSVRDSHFVIFVQLNKVNVHYILFFCKIPGNAKKLREIEFGSGKDRNSQYLVQYGGGTGPGTRPAIRVLVKLKPPSTELFATLSELCGWSQRVTFRATCRRRGASAALPTAHLSLLISFASFTRTGSGVI